MNTVDSLKKLYKTMAGKDWPYDPNPTDAEVIDKIAADGNAGSGGGCDCNKRIIDFSTLQPVPDTQYQYQYESGLSINDFFDCVVVTPSSAMSEGSFLSIACIQSLQPDYMELMFLGVSAGSPRYNILAYHPSTGVLSMQGNT